MDKKERINKAFDYLKFKKIIKTQEDVAKMMKASKSNVCSALKGVEGVLTESFIQRFSRTFGISFEWLLTGEGEMLKPTNGNTVTVGTAQQSTVVGGNYYGTPTRAHGEEPPFIEAEVVGAPVIPMSIMKTPNIDILQYVHSHRTGIECSGIRIDNMPIALWHRVGDHALEPAYNKGDLLGLCDYPQGKEDPIPGKIYAVDTRNNGMIVRILFPDGEDFRAHATNPDFPDFIIRRENIIRIYRKMIMVRI